MNRFAGLFLVLLTEVAVVAAFLVPIVFSTNRNRGSDTYKSEQTSQSKAQRGRAMILHTGNTAADQYHDVQREHGTIQRSTKSLASSYLVDILSRPSAEIWSLIPITQVEGVKDDMAEGAQAVVALQSVGSFTPSYVLECTRTARIKDINELWVKVSGHDAMERALLHVLSRVAAQRFFAAHQAQGEKGVWTIHLPDEEPAKIENISSEEGISKLYSSILDTTNVEMVEMVQQNGDALGMVPRPLVHKFNLLHRGIGMVVTKDIPILSSGHNKEYPDLYCHRRTDTKRIFPSLYDMFVGGVSMAGEDSATTAAREVAEELGLSAALSDSSSLSEPLFDCTVCTPYNRCFVTVFCYAMDVSMESILWQVEEVAWGDFVPYSVVEVAAELCTQRMVESKTWPGSYPPYIGSTNTRKGQSNKHLSFDNEDWKTWNFVPDGLLVWEDWLKWQNQK